MVSSPVNMVSPSSAKPPVTQMLPPGPVVTASVPAMPSPSGDPTENSVTVPEGLIRAILSFGPSVTQVLPSGLAVSA